MIILLTTLSIFGTPFVGKHEKRAAEMDLNLHVFLIGYTDDISSLVFRDSEDVQACIDIKDDKFQQNFFSTGLALNEDKCEIIMFRSHHQKNLVKAGDKHDVDRRSWKKESHDYII